MDLRKKCIVCDKGGNHLLVCKADDDDGCCPISVHQTCIGCKARFDDAGNFHCPYCRYKKSVSEFRKIKEMVLLTKQALSNFLEEEKEPKEGELVDKKLKGVSSRQKVVGVNKTVSGCDVENRGVGLERHRQSKTTLPCDTFVSVDEERADVNTCRIMVLFKPNSHPVDERDVVKADQRGGSVVNKRVKVGNGTRKANQQNATSIEEEEEEAVQLKSADLLPPVRKQVTGKKRNNSVAFNDNETSKRRKQCVNENAAENLISLQNGSQLQSNPNGKIDPNGARKESPTTKDISINNAGESKDSSVGRSVGHLLQHGKRRILWSEQEEDMLKEGVQKFTSSKGKNLPWKKILDFGRHVFDPCRNPSDLKDKWRKIAKRT
uniref:uncharacterized protein LOC122579331 n=1 Tax=Erigeron canadensis TaxID=72917 RepID=UPI001CB8F41C|nr:uncharacterized protein LOC122579331 [Erigeron canadensis]XP_043607421.1 uncharacterized protein LOC122579331 [Erigeron canadensis]